MMRLIQKNEQGKWCMRGISWDEIQAGEVISRKVWEMVYAGLCKLKDYEDTGLNPCEVEQMKDKVDDLNDFLKSETAKLLIELQRERQKHRWIPVEEDMPDMPPETGDYLVTMVIPGYNQGRPVTNWLSWDAEEKPWTEADGDPVMEKVIAWKPIPEPYKGEQ